MNSSDKTMVSIYLFLNWFCDEVSCVEVLSVGILSCYYCSFWPYQFINLS